MEGSVATSVKRLAEALASVGVVFREPSYVLGQPSYLSTTHSAEDVCQAVIDSVTRFPLPVHLEVAVSKAFLATGPSFEQLISAYLTFQDPRRGHGRYLVADAIRQAWSRAAPGARRHWIDVILVEVMQESNGASRIPLIRRLATCPGEGTLEVLDIVLAKLKRRAPGKASARLRRVARRSRLSAWLLGRMPLAILTWLETRSSVTLTHRNRAS